MVSPNASSPVLLQTHWDTFHCALSCSATQNKYESQAGSECKEARQSSLVHAHALYIYIYIYSVDTISVDIYKEKQINKRGNKNNKCEK